MSQTEKPVILVPILPDNPHMGDLVPLLPELYRRCAETLADPKAWTSKTLARARDGETIDPKHPQAVKWCAVGMVNRHAFNLLVEQRGEYYARRHISDLAQVAVTRLKPFVIESASAITQESLHGHEVTSINDNPRLGGYKAILAAFQSAAGVTVTLSAEARDHIERLHKRSQAAIKGWLTRRNRRSQGLVPVQEPSPMVFGGSLPSTDMGTVGIAQKEIAGVR